MSTKQLIWSYTYRLRWRNLQNVSFILIFVQNLSHEAAEGADFPKVDPDPVGVTKINIYKLAAAPAYRLQFCVIN